MKISISICRVSQGSEVTDDSVTSDQVTVPAIGNVMPQ